MHLDAVFAFVATCKRAVVSTVHSFGRREAALVGVALTPDRTLVFDASAGSRKAVNIRSRPHVALVVGRGDETTVQIEGIATFPSGEAADRTKAVYFSNWPEGRLRGKLA
jgi:pyridoxine/pyridoxamine 5'-phosphate oxidase